MLQDFFFCFQSLSIYFCHLWKCQKALQFIIVIYVFLYVVLHIWFLWLLVFWFLFMNRFCFEYFVRDGGLQSGNFGLMWVSKRDFTPQIFAWLENFPDFLMNINWESKNVHTYFDNNLNNLFLKIYFFIIILLAICKKRRPCYARISRCIIFSSVKLGNFTEFLLHKKNWKFNYYFIFFDFFLQMLSKKKNY